MKPLKTFLSLTVMAVSLLACSDSDEKNTSTDPLKVIDAVAALGVNCVEVSVADEDTDKNTSLSLAVVDTYISGAEFDKSAAEIVSYDACSDRLYVVNAEAATVDVLALSDEGSLTKTGTIDLGLAATKANLSIGAANSVVAKHGIVAVAIENSTKQENGLVGLFRSDDLSLIEVFSSGALPDMVNMTENGRYIVVANEGEPNGSYTIDPEGSLTIIDLNAGLSAESAVVTQLGFDSLNTQADELKSEGVRLPSPMGTTVAQDLEPEYIAVTIDGKAVVALQENNAFMTVDIASAVIESIKGLGVKRWDENAKLDYTNKDDVFSSANVEQMVGLYMPDSIASFIVDGETYIISANEGDGREYIYTSTQQICDDAGHSWDGDEFQPGGEDEDATKYANEEDEACISYTDEARGKDLDNVADAHPLSEASFGDGSIADKNAIGRIKVAYDDTDTAIAADDDILTFGARSFSIWDMNTELVYDSGDDLSQRANTTNYWNMTNDNNDADESNDNRSDDKGIEPEAVEVAVINGLTIAFVGLERHGGIAVYDVSNPQAPAFMDYMNNRNFGVDVCTAVDDNGECDNDTYNEAAGDLGPESIEYFSRQGQHYIAVGNEVSGTTTVYNIIMQ